MTQWTRTTVRIRDIALTNSCTTRGGRPWIRLALALSLAGCSGVGGIDNTPSNTLGNDETYAALALIWDGTREAITSKKEPADPTFTLPLSYALVCPSSGQRSYQGTLTGTNNAGTGSATLAMTASLTNCAVDDKVNITTVTASGVTISGTIAIANDAYAATNLHLTSTNVTVNGKACTGGIDVTIVGSAPNAQPTSTGTACGRSGSVPLP
jgi:hypothetical protein